MTDPCLPFVFNEYSITRSFQKIFLVQFVLLVVPGYFFFKCCANTTIYDLMSFKAFLIFVLKLRIEKGGTHFLYSVIAWNENFGFLSKIFLDSPY